MRKRVAGGLALVGALALGCSACSAGTNQAASSHHKQRTGKRVKSSKTKSHASSSTTTTTTSATTTTTAPALTRCTSAELSVTPGQFGAGLGHEGGAIVFENIGTTECTLAGYPGVAGLNSSGQQVAQARRTRDGYLGGFRTTSGALPVVDLQPGETASAFVEGTDVPQGSQTSCPEYTGLLVTPPTSKESVKVTKGLPGCTLQVHPIVSGSTGDAS